VVLKHTHDNTRMDSSRRRELFHFLCIGRLLCNERSKLLLANENFRSIVVSLLLNTITLSAFIVGV
jgi:hypothetical protein